MSQSKLLLCKSTFAYATQMKKICEPLTREFGVDVFWSWTLNSKGEATFVGNCPEICEFFFSNDLFNGHPYFRAPELIPTGFTLSDKVTDQEYGETQGKVKDRFSLDQLLVIIDSSKTHLTGYGFATTKDLPDLTNTYLNKLFLMKKFISYFQEEAKMAIKKSQDHTYNIASEMGGTFYKPTQHFEVFSSAKKRVEALDSLSDQERKCLKWMVKGRSASQIGKAMCLSPRTIESYMDNIKSKLGCESKQELYDLLLHSKEYLKFSFF